MRVKTLQNLYEKKFVTFSFSGLWEAAMGTPETTGCWLIYGEEKNGKTTFALKLAEMLSGHARTLYVSAEEGVGKNFVDACRRAGLEPKGCRNLHFEEYLALDELDAKLKSRKSPKIIFLDNTTVYTDEIRAPELNGLLLKHPDKLFIFIAHEEDGAPYTAAAKRASKLAKVIVRVRGLTAFFSGRGASGAISIDETKSALYWGQPTTENQPS